MYQHWQQRATPGWTSRNKIVLEMNSWKNKHRRNCISIQGVTGVHRSAEFISPICATIFTGLCTVVNPVLSTLYMNLAQ